MTTYDRRTDPLGAATWPAPNDYSAIHREQQRRMRVFAAEPYTDADCVRFFLFQTRDPVTGDPQHRTRRVSTMLQFLVSVSAAALGGSCSLNVAPGQFERTPDPLNARLLVPGPIEKATLEAGNAIWRRSCVEERIEEWATAAAAVGDAFFEVGWSAEDPNLAEFYALDAHTVKVWYDSRGKHITKAVIEFKYRPDGQDEEIVYKRTITADRIVTGEDGKRTAVKGRIVTEDGEFKQDVENALGICTVLHYRWAPRPGSPQLSACATTGYEDVVAKSDSASTQVSAIGTRHANPKLVGVGFSPEDTSVTGADGQTHGKSTDLAASIGIAQTEDLRYLQVDLGGVTAFRESTAGDMRMAREECPEFLMSESGANASGTALSMRAAAFTGKHGPKMSRFRATLARAVSMCLCMERMQPWSDAADIFVVSGSTPLPLDRAAELDVLAKAIDMRVLKQSDAIAAAQGLGIGPADAEPTTYAEELRAEDRALDADAGALLEKMRGPAPAKPVAVVDPEDPAEPPDVEDSQA